MTLSGQQIYASMQEDLGKQSVSKTSSNVVVVHNPDISKFKKIIPLYKKYYEKRQDRLDAEILDSYKKLVKLLGFNFIAAFDNDKDQFVGFMTFGQAPDMFLPNFEYRTVLDAVYVQDTDKELAIYNTMFEAAEKICRKVKSHRFVAKTGSDDFEQEKRLFSSNMNAFPCPDKQRIFFEFYLDK